MVFLLLKIRLLAKNFKKRPSRSNLKSDNEKLKIQMEARGATVDGNPWVKGRKLVYFFYT